MCAHARGQSFAAQRTLRPIVAASAVPRFVDAPRRELSAVAIQYEAERRAEGTETSGDSPHRLGRREASPADSRHFVAVANLEQLLDAVSGTSRPNISLRTQICKSGTTLRAESRPPSQEARERGEERRPRCPALTLRCSGAAGWERLRRAVAAKLDARGPVQG